MSALIVTGTDTGIGKTVVSAGLCAALNATYWKPVQSGLEEATDTETVATLAKVRTLPEAYRLQMPASPHLSAEAEGVTIDLARLALPQVRGPLVVEGAGGIMVPLTRQATFLDMFVRWQAPVVLVARTQLGTINHTALSLMALRGAGVPVVGVVFVGDAEPAVEKTIRTMFEVPHLGRLPRLDPLTPQALAQAFEAIDMDRVQDAL